MKSEENKQFLKKALQQNCKKQKNLAKRYKLPKGTNHLVKTEVLIILQNHKEKFINKPTWQLKGTKQLIEKINSKFLNQLFGNILETLTGFRT